MCRGCNMCVQKQNTFLNRTSCSIESDKQGRLRKKNTKVIFSKISSGAMHRCAKSSFSAIVRKTI